MNFYSFHIGDYLSATAHLSLLEHGVYRRLLDVYYVTESALPIGEGQVYRLIGARSRDEKEAVDVILAEFFEATEDGYKHSRCEHEIAICNKNRANGKRGGRPSKSDNPTETQPETQKKPKQNPTGTQPESPPSPHHPITPSPHPKTVSDASHPHPAEPGEAPAAQGSDKPEKLPCPAEEIVRLYHELMPTNPRCRVLNPARRRTIAVRWREAASLDADPFNGGYDTQADGLAKWREFFTICNESKFLTGKVQGFNGRPPFIADIDFLFSPSGFAKTLENRYHREAA